MENKKIQLQREVVDLIIENTPYSWSTRLYIQDRILRTVSSERLQNNPYLKPISAMFLHAILVHSDSIKSILESDIDWDKNISREDFKSIKSMRRSSKIEEALEFIQEYKLYRLRRWDIPVPQDSLIKESSSIELMEFIALGKMKDDHVLDAPNIKNIRVLYKKDDTGNWRSLIVPTNPRKIEILV